MARTLRLGEMQGFTPRAAMISSLLLATIGFGFSLHGRTYRLSVMVSVTCPEALMGLSAMVFYIMRSRDYPTGSVYISWVGMAPDPPSTLSCA